MRLVEDLGHYFRDVHLLWMAPFYPILRLVHPNFTAPLLQATGISPRSPHPSFSPAPAPSPSHSWTDQVEQGNGQY